MIKDIVVRAYTFAEKAHEGVERKFSGLPYFTHVKYVARVLEHLRQDEEVVAAGFLHDIIEDTHHTYDDIKLAFGERVADIVLGVTSDGDAMREAGGKRHYLAQKMVDMLEDSLTVKLADRFHNVLFLEGDETPKEFIKKYYKETKFILFSIEESERHISEAQRALVDRISAILEFLRIRYDF
jgi:(p)ppGpp synthase/HD superfamily hydrolase